MNNHGKYRKYKIKYENSKKDNNDLKNWADYIIVGAGAAGSVLAARLAQNLPNDKILVLELGQNNQNNSFIDNPADSMLLWNNPDGPHPSPTCLDFKTTQQLERTYTYPRGNGAGGSTNHHSMVDGRGSYKIYDRIAKIVNDDVWASKNVWKYFKKMESYNVPFVDGTFHGKDGWLQIKSVKPNSALQKDFLFATNNLTGAPIRYDFSENPHNVAGVGFSDTQITDDNKRSYAFKDLLAPLLNNSTQNNIQVLFNVLVTKVLLQPIQSNTSQAKYQAIGVETLNSNDYHYSVDCSRSSDNSSNNTQNKIPIIYKARKEVILCGGSINTPQLLMLSGIGPRQHLETIGIPVLLDMPGVGSDLLDHHEASISYEVDSSKHVWPVQASTIIDNIDKSSKKTDKLMELKKHLEQFAHIGDGAIMFDWYSGLDTNGNIMPQIINDDDPDLHIHSISGFFYDFDFNSIEPLSNGEQRLDYFRSQTHLDNKYFLRVFHSFLIETLKINKAEGTIRLASTDPTQAPIIDLGLYKDDIACERMARGIMMMRKIIMQPELLKYYKLDSEGRPKEIFPGYHINALEDLKYYLKRWSSIGHHMSGTAKICDTTHDSHEVASEKKGVVDSKLCVLGVSNLRVIDNSIYPFPELHGYNTARAAYVVGEIGADIILNKNK